MSILSKLLLDVGISAETEPRNTIAGKFLSAEGVWGGPEWERIRVLERWSWRDAQDINELVDVMTARFRRTGSTAKLLPMQAVCLYSYIVFGKLCNVANVGTGKTIVSALIPTAGENTRPLHITYAKLQRKTIKEFRILAEDWNVSQAFKFISAEKLSRADSADFLENYDPDVIIVDESHLFKSPKSGRTKRVGRHLKNRPSCKLVPLTGTPGDDSISNVAHIHEWVHGDKSPLPRTYNESTQWGQALDAVVNVRRAPGVLAEFVPDGRTDLESVRRAVGLRIEETPGNVFHRSSDSVACSLYLDAVECNARYPKKVDEYFAHVRKTELAPDGREFVEIQTHNALTTMSLGFYRVFAEPAPKAWSEARKLYRAFINDILSQTKYGLDTAQQVGDLCHQGKLDSGGVYEAWKEIEPTFASRTLTEWFDHTAIEFATEWLHENEGVVWTPFPEFGKLLSERAERKFFWREGLCGKLSIEDYDGSQGCVLSTQANYLGRNLQDRYAKFLVFAPAAKSDILEQLCGRFHRQGQRAESVEGSFFLGSIEHYEALMRARERAKLDRDLNRNESVKLLTCDWLVPDWAEISKWSGPRWKK